MAIEEEELRYRLDADDIEKARIESRFEEEKNSARADTDKKTTQETMISNMTVRLGDTVSRNSNSVPNFV